MIKLMDILWESKQVGSLYHFTLLDYLPKILQDKYLKPNWVGEEPGANAQVSTTRKANVDVNNFIGTDDRNMARLMLDGNKISTKYEIKPYSFSSMGKNIEEYEEQIIVNGKNFYFLPYLKRIDLFIVDFENKNIAEAKKALETNNISYTEYEGTPMQNIPYTQNK
jgi:hypothetical protein